eukprot:gene12646-6549_t
MENNIDIPRSEPIEIPKRKTENIQEYMKNYKQINKDKLREKAREKHTCELCGGRYTKSGKYLHLKTKKHQKIYGIIDIKLQGNKIQVDDTVIGQSSYLKSYLEVVQEGKMSDKKGDEVYLNCSIETMNEILDLIFLGGGYSNNRIECIEYINENEKSKEDTIIEKNCRYIKLINWLKYWQKHYHFQPYEFDSMIKNYSEGIDLNYCYIDILKNRILKNNREIYIYELKDPEHCHQIDKKFIEILLKICEYEYKNNANFKSYLNGEFCLNCSQLFSNKLGKEKQFLM